MKTWEEVRATKNPNRKTYGRIAYEAFMRTRLNADYPWEKVSQEGKDDWYAVGHAVAEEAQNRAVETLVGLCVAAPCAEEDDGEDGAT